MNVLNVAEKPSAAKSIAEALCRGGKPRIVEGFSKFNKVYCFSYNAFGGTCNMRMTSVAGHLMNHDFTGQYRGWNSCDPIDLFHATIISSVGGSYKNIEKTLKREAPQCQKLIIWTDCDREGENIGFEIIRVCLEANRRLDVYRARFSEITYAAVTNAMRNLVRPDERASDAVECRSELDLRVGAAFTRLMTLNLRDRCGNYLGEKALVSYGPCQFPTLGFVVERYNAFCQFISEVFWKIRVIYEFQSPPTIKGKPASDPPAKRRRGKQGEDSSLNRVEFRWQRVRLFDKVFCEIILDICQQTPEATVIALDQKPKSKWRPFPMDTIELEKLASRFLKISAKETMKIAEKLYMSGLISYPRTETNIFPDNFNLVPFIEAQTGDGNWGQFAQEVLQRGPTPKRGKKSDQAHPPIHPLKAGNSLQGNEKRVYELIVRHFLATCHDDAKGKETTLTIKIVDETFIADGLVIEEYNYLNVYVYERWESKYVPHFPVGHKFIPTTIEMVEGKTSPPQLLSEADLIALMDKHGIGTDATHAEHIETIQERKYVGMTPDRRFLPGRIGMALVEGMDSISSGMSKPFLRAHLEASLKDICEGRRTKQDVLQENIANYQQVFQQTRNQMNKIKEAVSKYVQL